MEEEFVLEITVEEPFYRTFSRLRDDEDCWAREEVVFEEEFYENC